MKWKLPVWLCVVISLALVAFGLVFGTLRGFRDEQAQVLACLESENGLLDVLSYRGADGLNLCVVARRHLTGDADVTALETAARCLQSSTSTLMEKKAADEALEQVAASVAQKLKASDSFQQSQRDPKYLDMLLGDMQSLSGSAAAQTYNQAAQNFNNLLSAPVTGSFAALLGVEPCALYQ